MIKRRLVSLSNLEKPFSLSTQIQLTFTDFTLFRFHFLLNKNIGYVKFMTQPLFLKPVSATIDNLESKALQFVRY